MDLIHRMDCLSTCLITTTHNQTQIAVIVKLVVSTAVSEVPIATFAMTTTVPIAPTLTVAHVLHVIL